MSFGNPFFLDNIYSNFMTLEHLSLCGESQKKKTPILIVSLIRSASGTSFCQCMFDPVIKRMKGLCRKYVDPETN